MHLNLSLRSGGSEIRPDCFETRTNRTSKRNRSINSSPTIDTIAWFCFHFPLKGINRAEVRKTQRTLGMPTELFSSN